MNSPCGKGQVKTGRKGDPRMHRSVAARLDNPELSLFEALRMGGFDYAADEDASIMDTEKVTLGQRKNQLSRRLRLARKQQDEAGEGGGVGMGMAAAGVAGGVGSMMNVGGIHNGGGGGGGMIDHDGGMMGLSGMGGMSGAAAFNAKVKMQLQQQQQNGAMSSEAQRQLEKLMLHSQQAKLTSGVKRNNQLMEGLGPDAEMHLNDEEINLMDEKANPRRMAKFHPQFQQLFVPRAASARSSFTGGGAASQLSSQLSSQLGGTPQLGPLSAPMNPLTAPPSSFGASVNQGLFPSGAGGLLGQQALTQRRSTVGHPSGVAIASLSSTAGSIGLSLEQLAVALSSSSNLVKVLSNNSGSEQQQELALRLFRNESRALYQRCMLLAGFRPDDAEEKSQNHLQFAFSAWQMEGKRLQELMGDDNNGNNAGTSNLVGMNALTSMNPNAMNGVAGLNGQLNGASNVTSQQLQLLQQDQKMPSQGQAHGHGHNHDQKMPAQETHGHSSHGHNDHHDSNMQGDSGHSHGHSHGHGHSHEHHVDGHHIHQLEGKCGHKAIIHQPKDGSAHIDFIVGNRVECYSGIQPMGNKSLSAWPSKYKCEDLSCPPPCAETVQCEQHAPQPVDLDSSRSAPKLLDLSDIDLSGTEWNSDLNGSMGGTLLGLFKLGDTDNDGPSSQQNGDNSGDSFEIQV